MSESGKRGHSGGRGGGGGGGNKKAKYFTGNNNKSNATIPHGAQGFFFTCENSRENKTAHNMMEALNEAYDKLRPPAKEMKKEEEKKEEGKDIQAALAEEIAELKNPKTKRFQKLDAGLQKGIGFIKMLPPPEGSKDEPLSPPELAMALMEHIKETKERKSRYCMRFIPVENVCFASKEKIEETMKPLIDKHFPKAGEGVVPIKFSVLHESRASSHLDRMEIIDLVAKLVPEPHKVDLSSPDKSILVSVMKSICMVGVLSNYHGLAKYNCNVLAMTDEERAEACKATNFKPVAKVEFCKAEKTSVPEVESTDSDKACKETPPAKDSEKVDDSK